MHELACTLSIVSGSATTSVMHKQSNPSHVARCSFGLVAGTYTLPDFNMHVSCIYKCF